MIKTKVTILGPSHPYRGGIVHFNTSLVAAAKDNDSLDTQVVTWKRLYPTFLLPKPESEFQDHRSKETYSIENEQRFLDYLNPLTWLKLVRKVRSHRSDIFLVHWQQPVQFPVYLAIFLLLKLFTKAKVYTIAHNVTQHENSAVSSILSKIIFKLSNTVVAHSSSEADKAAEIVGEDKVISLYHPLYNIFASGELDRGEIADELGLDASRKYLLFFGFIRPYKGLEYLIEAYNLIAKDNPKLDLIIAGELFWKVAKKQSKWQKFKRLPFKVVSKLLIRKANVEQYNPLALISKYGLEGRVKVFNSYIPNEDVYKYFTVSEALVLPYVSASQSGPVQIAYNYNKPVLASAVGGLNDVIENDKSGYLFTSQDPADIAQKIEKFVKSRRKWSESVDEYKQRFSWESYIRAILSHYYV